MPIFSRSGVWHCAGSETVMLAADSYSELLDRVVAMRTCTHRPILQVWVRERAELRRARPPKRRLCMQLSGRAAFNQYAETVAGAVQEAQKRKPKSSIFAQGHARRMRLEHPGACSTQ